MPKPKINYHEHDDLSAFYPDVSHVASATETTGLTHKAPSTDEEWESYQQLASLAIPRKKPESK